MKVTERKNLVYNAKPFVKWAGGKRQLINILLENVPNFYNRYFEPFIGGGALYFHLQPKSAFISDINSELINTYQVIKKNPNALICDLKNHKHTEKYFYKIRNIDRKNEYKLWTDVQKASRFIYLNKTCFNGLFRVNSKGHFNVPFGKYKNPKILDGENLIECSNLLNNAIIKNIDFEKIFNYVSIDDFVYIDPPYYPISSSSSFTKYNKSDFNEEEQVRLKTFCDKLNNNGVKFMLSNSHSDFILELYKAYNITIIKAKRAINSKGNGRGKVKEILVRNY